ncbi:MAG: hypothetical protein JWM68_4926 [Verrucomicrobiales bacterium]|nr:hypothetical protein [Verrucomicrobiales bacterium]
MNSKSRFPSISTKAFYYALRLLILILPCPNLVSAFVSETCGFWIDAYHPGFKGASEVTKLVADVRAANANAVFVQVRKRGDAYYESKYEPKAGVLAADYDPLADIIAKAHDTNGGPRIEVHAWLTVYPVWNGIAGLPQQTNHPYRLHPDWLCKNFQGGSYDGRMYSFDPGHPEAQQYLFNVAMDVVSKYDVDGLQLDYIHYSGKDWGYNAKAVKRFNDRFNRKGQPSPDDAAWMQFRRDQVSSLLRKIYLSVNDAKPKVKVSAATITWPAPPNNEDEWFANSSAYNRVFQDWRSWMSEGILDINMPMVYSPHDQPGYHRLYSTWVEFAKAHRYNRHVVISPAAYMNSVSGTVAQIREALAPGKTGNAADGVCLFSYGSYSSEPGAFEDFASDLTHRSRRGGDVPVFPTPVAPPEMPWKTQPAMGHLKGFVYAEGTTNVLDGANLTMKGPMNRAISSDATGFYGSVDLLPGDYSVTATFTGYNSVTNHYTVKKGSVTTLNVQLSKQ